MYDVIVTGAGPAGSTCARACAQQGLRVLLLDKDTFPRSKPCGGAVSEQALSYLDFTIPREIIEKECFGARIQLNDRCVEVRKSKRIAVLVSRNTFDFFLLKKAQEAGAEARQGEKVLTVRGEHGCVQVTTEHTLYAAHYVIGADGVHSRVAPAVRPPFRRDEIAVALVSRIPASDEYIDERLRDRIGISFGIAPTGYGWVFPHKGYYSVGVAGLASEFPGPRAVLSDFARSFGAHVTNPRGHVIPYGGMRRNIGSGRVLLVGDAAGFADPFHGEGIVYAILSGKLAAEAVAESIKNNKAGAAALSRYERTSERLIRKNLRVARCMAKLLTRVPNLFVRIFFDNTGVIERYLDIPAGKLDYRRFARWLAVRSPFYLLSSYLRTADKARNQSAFSSLME